MPSGPDETRSSEGTSYIQLLLRLGKIQSDEDEDRTIEFRSVMSEGSGKKESGVTDVRINVRDGHSYMRVISEDIEDDEFLPTTGHKIRGKINRPVPLHVCIFLADGDLMSRTGLCRQFAKIIRKIQQQIGQLLLYSPKK